MQFSYMGTKRYLAPRVAELVSNCRSGPFLDLFAGTCALATCVGASRSIWSNDTQVFASEVARALTQSKGLPIRSADSADVLYSDYHRNYSALQKRWRNWSEKEEALLANGDVESIREFESRIPNVRDDQNLNTERKRLARKPDTFPYRLFSMSYAGAYFGVRQSWQIDSIRYAIDKSYESGKLSDSNHRWLLLALCQSMARSSTTTGHFAQCQTINSNNRKRYIKNRSQSVWVTMLDALDEFRPIGASKWRTGNRVFCRDASSLLQYLKRRNESPAVIYADPPYTRDQYSRYYHLYETLLLYDYPDSEGVGRYRPDRFTSDFSLKQKFIPAFQLLAKRAAALSSELIVSYPENGLIEDAKDHVLAILRSNFRFAPEPSILDHVHSSLGGANSNHQTPVKELLFYAR